MPTRIRFVIAAILATGAVCGSDWPPQDLAEVARYVESIKQPPALRKWEQIPWLIDLNEGMRTARVEHRPIFLWVAGDEPLERC